MSSAKPTPRRALVNVSDRALIRFIERAGGVNVEGLRATLEASLERAASAAVAAGVTDYRIVADGLTYVMRSRNGQPCAVHSVISVLDDADRSRG